MHLQTDIFRVRVSVSGSCMIRVTVSAPSTHLALDMQNTMAGSFETPDCRALAVLMTSFLKFGGLGLG